MFPGGFFQGHCLPNTDRQSRRQSLSSLPFGSQLSFYSPCGMPKSSRLFVSCAKKLRHVGFLLQEHVIPRRKNGIWGIRRTCIGSTDMSVSLKTRTPLHGHIHIGKSQSGRCSSLTAITQLYCRSRLAHRNNIMDIPKRQKTRSRSKSYPLPQLASKKDAGMRRTYVLSEGNQFDFTR